MIESIQGGALPAESLSMQAASQAAQVKQAGQEIKAQQQETVVATESPRTVNPEHLGQSVDTYA